MNLEATLARIIAADDAEAYDECLAILSDLTPRQVNDLMAFDNDYSLCAILWALAPHWGYAVNYAHDAQCAESDRILDPEQMPPADQLHHDRPLREHADYTPHYHQWMAEKVGLHVLAAEAKQYMPVDYAAEIARCDDAIASIMAIVPDADPSLAATMMGRVREWRNRRADLVAHQGGAA